MEKKNELLVYLITDSGFTIDVRASKESAEKEVKRLKELDRAGSYRFESWEVEE
jgi:hypothetical protein